MGQDGRLSDLWKIMDRYWTPPPTRKDTSEPEPQLAIMDGKAQDPSEPEVDSADDPLAPAKPKAIKGAAVVKHARSLERKSMSGEGAASVPSMPAAASQPSKVDLPTPRKDDIVKKREQILKRLESVRQGLVNKGFGLLGIELKISIQVGYAKSMTRRPASQQPNP